MLLLLLGVFDLGLDHTAAATILAFELRIATEVVTIADNIGGVTARAGVHRGLSDHSQ